MTVATPGAAGMAGSRRGMTAAIRLLSRAFDVLSVLEGGRPSEVVLPVLGGLGDVRLALRLRETTWWPGAAEWITDGIDVALRIRAGGGRPGAALPALVADLVPTSIMAAYQQGAGLEAVPVADPTVAFPPRSALDWVGKATRATAPTLVGLVAVSIGARPSDRPRLRRDVLVIGGAASALTMLGVRYRARLQAMSRRTWQQRAAVHVEAERRAARLDARTAQTVGHGFAKTLVALGELGDAAAGHVGRTAMDEPRRLLEGASEGAVLRSVVGGLRIEPPDAARLWVPEDQAAHLRTQMAEAEARATDGAEQTLHVVEVTAGRTRLRWLDQDLELVNEPPVLAMRLYPTLPALAIAAHYKLVPFLGGTVTLAACAGPALLDLLTLARFRQPPTDDELGLLLGRAAASTTLACLLFSLPPMVRHDELGRRQTHQTSATIGLVTVVASHWSRLSPRQRLTLPAAGLLWAVTLRSGGPLPLTRWLGEAAFLAMPLIATWRMTDRLDEEASVLQRSLQRDFERQLVAARSAAEQEILADYANELGVADAALARLGDAVPARLRLLLEHDCDELRTWLADRGLTVEPTEG